jgi:diketogulonate reductase-like aldo/keto reductase
MAELFMKTVSLGNGQTVPALGIGTWKMGESVSRRDDELAALRRSIDLGMTLIDTAEMYGEGAAEELIAEAIHGRRDQVFLVSKVYPHNAGRRGAVDACDRSLRRLRVDRIDLYLLHWRGSIPLDETFAAFEKLVDDGKIGAYGVSNLDTKDMQEVWKIPSGKRVVVNQILYNLTRRAVEHDLLHWCRQRKVAIMAYSPVEQGDLLRNRKLIEVARNRGATPAQVAIAWLLAQPEVIVIPKAGNPRHVEENRGAADIQLTAAEMDALDRAFPRPRERRPLEML